MIKIQTVVRITDSFPAGIAHEYIWLEGQSWPVPSKDDVNILKIECFGDELKNSSILSFADTETPLYRLDEVTLKPKEVIYRSWLRHDAAYVSAQMRLSYP